MALKIRLRCPGCQARITAPAELHGQRRLCPGCSTHFVVRHQRPQDSDPMLVTFDAMNGGAEIQRRAG